MCFDPTIFIRLSKRVMNEVGEVTLVAYPFHRTHEFTISKIENAKEIVVIRFFAYITIRHKLLVHAVKKESSLGLISKLKSTSGYNSIRVFAL